MDRLTDIESIRAFVDMIVEGGGKAYKPLTRQDLYELCKYCKSLEAGGLSIGMTIPSPVPEPQCPPLENLKEEQTTNTPPADGGDSLPVPPEDNGQTLEDICAHCRKSPVESLKIDEREDNPTEGLIPDFEPGCSESPAPEEAPADPWVGLTRAEAYHSANMDAQEAYDAFLKWSATHSKDGQAFVMDFEHGKRSEAAAFAYWLLGRIHAGE